MSKTRANGIIIVSGRQGVGKSYNLMGTLKAYAGGVSTTNWKPSRVLIYDINDEYKGVPIVSWGQIQNNTIPEFGLMRVLAFKITKDGKSVPFDVEERKKGFLMLLQNYRNGALVLEDFNTYALNTRSQKVLATLVTARHRQIDIFIILQEIGKVTTDIWGNLAYYIYHKQASDILREKKKVTNFPLFAIADNCVSEQFDKATRLYHEGKLAEKDYERIASYHVIVSNRDNKIYGASLDRFKRAVERYLKGSDNYKSVRRYCSENGLDFKKLEDREKAIHDIINGEYMPYYGGQTLKNAM